MTTLLIGCRAPNFSTTAVQQGKMIESFSLESFAKEGKYVVLFFYPLDFTFVCPTELHAFQEKLPEFQQRKAEVLGCSIDSAYSHLAWMEVPKHRGGIQGVEYPILSDLNKSISRSYHVLGETVGVAYRGLFIIDRQGIIRHQLVNDLPIGRSVDEVLRVLDALIFHEEHGQVCPANWKEGAKAMKADAEGLVEFFKQ